MVDIVGAEAGAHQLLEEVSLFIRALGRAEANERATAMLVANALQARRRAIERLFPGSLAEMRPGIGGIDRLDIVDVLADAVLADHRHGEAQRIVHIVEAEAPLDAEPVLIGRTGAAIDIEELVVLDLVGELAADAAIGADAVDLAIRSLFEDAFLVEQRLLHERAGGAGLHAFAAGDASARTHGIVEIEDDLLAMPAPSHADDIIDLHLAAGADAEIALDTGVEIDRHRGMADIGLGLRALGETAGVHADAIGPAPEFGIGVMGDLALGLIGEQQLEHHLAREFGALARRLDLHAGRGLADAGRREHALPFDLDHAGAAIAVGAVTGLGAVAEMGDLDAAALSHLPDRLAGQRLDLLAVEEELHRIPHHTGAIAHDRTSNRPRPDEERESIAPLTTHPPGNA